MQEDLKIFYYGSPILREKLPKIEEIPEGFDRLVESMFELMSEEEGIGLSANQVGKGLRFFIADFSLYKDDMAKKVFINPKILEREGKTRDEEGCLSLPEIKVNVDRADRIKVHYRDRDLKEHTKEFTGYLSRVIQHETDHLNGTFMTDRISPLKRKLLDNKLKQIAKMAKKELKQS
ncbi:MAG: peptide deformylase [Candidatus Marinimicrobia bacterium]|nr:peptide deformylase [Candidatus Neomarinimicrobiota bacterium]